MIMNQASDENDDDHDEFNEPIIKKNQFCVCIGIYGSQG